MLIAAEIGGIVWRPATTHHLVDSHAIGRRLDDNRLDGTVIGDQSRSDGAQPFGEFEGRLEAFVLKVTAIDNFLIGGGAGAGVVAILIRALRPQQLAAGLEIGGASGVVDGG